MFNYKGFSILLVSLLFLISVSSATSYFGYNSENTENLQKFGTFKQSEKCVNLIQTCGNCTYNNITQIMRTGENPEEWTLNSIMSKDGTVYNFTFCNITEIGIYNVNGFGDPYATETTWVYTIEVTPSGFGNILGFFGIIIGISYTIAFIGFFGRNEWVSIMGGLFMMALGIYIISNGIDIYRNFITTAFSYFTIGLGGLFTIVPLVESMQKD